MIWSSILSTISFAFNLWDRAKRKKGQPELQPCFSVCEKRIPLPPGSPKVWNPPQAFLHNSGKEVARNVTWTFIMRDRLPRLGKPEPVGNIGTGMNASILRRGYRVRPVAFKQVSDNGGLHICYDDAAGKRHECRLVGMPDGSFRNEDVIRPCSSR
jgi:hypothetical protein